MSRNFFKNDYYRKKPKKKVSKLDTRDTKFKCKCCKNSFKTQARFSNHDKKYRNYCSECRKVCYMCRSRHGGRGNTCTKYCADRYKKLKWQWKKKTKHKEFSALDKKLKNFTLHSINENVLKVIFGAETKFIQERSKAIATSMEMIQSKTNLTSDRNKLYLSSDYPDYYIDKESFYLRTIESDTFKGRIEENISKLGLEINR